MATICSSVNRFFITALSGPRFYIIQLGHFQGSGHASQSACATISWSYIEFDMLNDPSISVSILQFPMDVPAELATVTWFWLARADCERG
jgi:hypothetical protein